MGHARCPLIHMTTSARTSVLRIIRSHPRRRHAQESPPPNPRAQITIELVLASSDLILELVLASSDLIIKLVVAPVTAAASHRRDLLDGGRNHLDILGRNARRGLRDRVHVEQQLLRRA